MASGETGRTARADRGRRWTVEDPQPRSTLDDLGRQPDFWILLLRARMAATLLLPLALIAFPAFGPNRFVLAVAAGLAGLWANVTLLDRAQAGRPVRGRVAAADIAFDTEALRQWREIAPYRAARRPEAYR